MEVQRREKIKMLKEKEREERRRKLAEEREVFGEEEISEEETGEEEEEEEEEPLPEIFIPPTPSPILCGFYSAPGKFWLSVVSTDPLPSPGYGRHFFHPVHSYAHSENLILG